MRPRVLRLLEGAAPALVVGVTLLVALAGMIPPTAVPADAAPDVFSADRAMAHVEVIGAEPRPMGSAANADAREYVADQLAALGLEVSTGELTVPSYYSDEMVAVVNTWAVIPGTDPTGAIVLMGHIDTVPETPGANDDAVAVATVLEAGRAILAGPSLRNTVVLMITDAEEPAPRWGANAIAADPGDIGFVINFEAIGRTGPSIVTEVAGNEPAIVGRFAAAVPRPVVTSVLDDVAELIGGSNTDFAPFRDRGIPGIEFAHLQDSAIYHTPADDVASVGVGSLQHHGTHALSLARAFGEVDLAELAGSEQAVFFSIGGRVVVAYPAWFGLVIAVVLLLMLGTGVRFDGAVGSWRAVLGAAGAQALLALGVGVGLAVTWRVVSIVLWADAGPRGLVAIGWWAVAAVGAVGATLWWRRRLLRTRDAIPFEWGGVAVWATLAVLLAWPTPGVSYLFAWPALAAVALMARRPDARWARLGALGVVSAPAVVLAVPVLDVFFVLAAPRPGNPGSSIPEVMLLFGFLFALVTLLLAPQWERAGRG